jgi:hypothetical protein
VLSVFKAIERVGHDGDFEPAESASFQATGAPPGSLEKLELLRQRVGLGQPLWHENDRTDFAGLKSAEKSIVRGPQLRQK